MCLSNALPTVWSMPRPLQNTNASTFRQEGQAKGYARTRFARSAGLSMYNKISSRGEMTPSESSIQTAYALAKERYAALGVDTESALARLENVAISLHCWQGDDVGGFENPGGEFSGGIAATGNYPGKAPT